jgi:hypothetical protein
MQPRMVAADVKTRNKDCNLKLRKSCTGPADRRCPRTAPGREARLELRELRVRFLVLALGGVKEGAVVSPQGSAWAPVGMSAMFTDDQTCSLTLAAPKQARYKPAVWSRSVAQPGSAHRSGRWGRRFKSCHSDQSINYLGAFLFPLDLPAHQFPTKTINERGGPAANRVAVWQVHTIVLFVRLPCLRNYVRTLRSFLESEFSGEKFRQP